MRFHACTIRHRGRATHGVDQATYIAMLPDDDDDDDDDDYYNC